MYKYILAKEACVMHLSPRRIPTVVWTGILAFVLTVFAGGVWTVLLISNVATSPAIPWAVAVMALLLWLMWQYLGGKWWPRSTSQARRRYLRARPVTGQVFALGFAGRCAVDRGPGWVLDRVVPTREDTRARPSELLRYPLLSVALVLVMASLVSSLAEEAGFRGTSRALWNAR